MPVINARQTIFTTQKVVDVDDLRKSAAILRGEVVQLVRSTGVKEIGQQAQLKNPISSLLVGKKRYGLSNGKDVPPTTAQQIAATEGEDRIRIFYQGNTNALVQALIDIYRRIERETPRQSGEAFSTFYFRGYTRDGGYTPRLTLGGAITWLRKQTDPLTSIRIEGPQTPYRRKLIYVYANRRGSVERLKARGKLSGKTILDERYEFGGRYRLLAGRTTNRLQPYAYKAYLKAIAQYYRQKYKDLWIGYRFVQLRATDPLKSYPSATGFRPWGRRLPQIYIGLKPVRRG
jgi:hypothetical protein